MQQCVGYFMTDPKLMYLSLKQPENRDRIVSQKEVWYLLATMKIGIAISYFHGTIQHDSETGNRETYSAVN